MDYSKFMDANFDAKDWVNAAFRQQREPGVTIDQHATTMVMKLQMFIQEVNNVLEEASQQALQNLPRVTRELDAVKQESVLLRDQMRSVKQDIENVEKNTAQSMQTLLTLDSIKSRMKTTADALKEADNWTTLSADMEEVFQSQDVTKITEKLAGMQQSLQILVDTPDYADKCQHLEKLKNRLEALISPQLIAAFNAQSLEATQKFTHMFEDMERLPQLYKYYHKCYKTQIVQQWRTICETEGTVPQHLTELYDMLQSTWHMQIMWTSTVFKEPVPVIVDMLTDALQTLDPSLATRFADHLQHSAGDTLPALLELKQISERFAKSIESAVESYMNDGLEESHSLEQLLRAVYQPYRPYLLKYKVFEEVSLGKQLDDIPLDHEEVFDTVQLLSESVSKVFSAANKSNERCRQLTNGFCYLGLLDAFKTFFCTYTRELRRVVVNIGEKCKGGGAQSEDTEDWSNFQHSLRIIQTCGLLVMHTEELDKQLISSILHSLAHLTPSHVEHGKKVNSKLPTLSFQASLFLTNKEDVEALESFVIQLEEGDRPSVLTEVMSDLGRLCEEVHKLAFEIVFAQLQNYLANVSTMEVWTSQSAGGALTSDLPTFSLAPQEYITKIGQYMMTLPQHLDPFTIQDSPALTMALRHSKLPYTSEQEPPEHLADLWLESVARGTMHVFGEQILTIPHLTPHGTKQLITDIEYLRNVLDDLDLQMSELLSQVDTLLKVTPDDFTATAEVMPQRIAHTIAAMRRIHT